MAYLAAHGYRVVKLSDLVSAAQAGGRCVALTFDDGYRDVHDAAWPILQRYGFQATMFLVSGWMRGEPGLDGPHAPLLTLAQVREMARCGVEFGTHGRTHAALVGLPPDQLWAEVAGSREELEQMLGLPITMFAYPYGLYDAPARQAVGDAGYALAAALFNGTDDPLALFRWEVGGPGDWLPLTWKLSPWPYAVLRAWRGSPLRSLWRTLRGLAAFGGHVQYPFGGLRGE